MMAEETPKQEKSAKARFPGSSPTRLDRLSEKEELQGLNDRLAVYIDRVRNLEDEKSRLSAKLLTYEEHESREFEAARNLYEAKNNEIKILLDDALEDARKLRLDNSRLREDIDDLKRRHAKECKDKEKLKETVNELNVVIFEKDHQLQDLDTVRTRNAELEDELNQLQKQLSSAKSACDHAKLMQQKYEEKVNTLTDESKFTKELYERELYERKLKMESMQETTETDFKEKFDTRLEEKLQEIREEYEMELEEIKKELVEGQKSELDDLKSQLQAGRSVYNELLITNQDLKTMSETLKGNASLLESKKLSLERRISDLELMRQQDKEEHNKMLKICEEDVRRLNEDYDDLKEEYDNLVQVNITLDLEISNYKKLLEVEEARLNISPKPSPSERRTGKRTREESFVKERVTSSNAHGSIKVSEVDPEGRFVKIFNSSTMDEPLGGYSVQKTSGDGEPVSFKFNPRSILKGGAVITIWSPSAGVKHKPPHDLVMKDTNWVTGENTVTTIVNPEEQTIATFSEEQKSVTREMHLRPRRRRYEPSKNESCVIS